MTTATLVKELKENNEDFEFYPTTKEMIKCIYNRIDGSAGNILDIGCGTCNFKKYFDEFNHQATLEYDSQYDKWLQTNRDKSAPSRGFIKNYHKYYVIEKSQILLKKLDKNIIVLGTDFNSTLLLDKKAETYFCNPPYSQYEDWTCRIISEGNFKKAYLIIPQRWETNETIQTTIKNTNSRTKIIGEFDFCNAERNARAKVHIVEIDKRSYSTSYGYNDRDLKDFEENAFNKWFDETFKMRDSSTENKYEYEIEKDETERIKHEIVNSKSKGQLLVDLYNAEQLKFFEHFKAISSLDVDILETIGIKKEAVKEALKQKCKSLKSRYWKIVFDEFEEITDRLTSTTRNEMFNRFLELQTVDFTLENIYPLILWVIKNANGYYDDQLINFFKKLSSPENVRQYKSNKKVFELDQWRHTSFKNPDKISHYTLDYRIIMSSPFKTDWHGNLEVGYETKDRLQDIFTIAKNLGFEIGLCDLPKCFGEECSVLYKGSDKKFMSYRVYKNGNMHVKFDIEFAKAMNVEVSRLLGWIRHKEDIKNEFPDQLAKDAEKYFKANKFINIASSNLLLLTASA